MLGQRTAVGRAVAAFAAARPRGRDPSWGHPASANLLGHGLQLPMVPQPRRQAPPRGVLCLSSSSSSAAASQGSAPTNRPPTLNQGEELVKWISSSGGEVAGVRVGNAGAAGWCLAADRDLPVGSVLIKLPESCQLTYGGEADTDPAVLRLVDKVPQELWGAKLALQVLSHRARADSSPYSPYIGLLPKAVEGLPMFFSGPAIKALQYPTIIAQISKRCQFLLKFAEEEIAPVTETPDDPFGGQVVDANALGWALAVVTSRAFRTKGPELPASMLPLIDMCNHSFDPNCEVRPSGSGTMEMVTKRPVTAGEELFLSYGATLGNDFLLLDYGFIIDNNPNDGCQLAFDLSLLEAGRIFAETSRAAEGTDDAAAEDIDAPSTPSFWQQQLLSDVGLGGKANEMVVVGGPSSQPIDRRLLAAARIMSAKKQEDVRPLLAGVSSSRAAEALGTWGRPLPSAAQETAALQTLLGVAALVLGRFPTSVQEDLQALGVTATADGSEAASSGITEEDMRTAVRFRVELKKSLLKAINLLSAGLRELEGISEKEGAAGKKQQPRRKQQSSKGRGASKKKKGKK